MKISSRTYRSAAKPPRPAVSGKKKWIRKILLVLLLGGLLVLTVAGLWLTSIISPLRQRAFERDLSRLDTKRFPVPQATIITDSHGEVLGRIFIENRKWIEYENVPKYFIDALIASEDKRFLEHEGIDIVGICRAAINNFRGRNKQGGSTLTQQLARGVFGLPQEYRDERGKERSYNRKIEEIFLSQRIEEYLGGDKEEILEQYVNRIYFGSGCYGVHAASQHYFDKEPSELNLQESASLVGLIPSPNRLNPEVDLQENQRVRNNVLQRMREEGYIKKATYKRVRQLPVEIRLTQNQSSWGHLFSAIRTQVSDLIGWENASQGGYLVETTVDLKLQKIAQNKLEQALQEIEAKEGYSHSRHNTNSAAGEYLEGAMMMVDLQTGAVLAMVGGRDFEKSEFNYATQARKPPGTAFLPVTYMAAFSPQGGYSPVSLIEDSPIDLRRIQVGGLEGIMGEWGMGLPEGHPNLMFEGLLPARRCLEQSKLAAAVRLGERVGLAQVAETAVQLGIPIKQEQTLYNRLLIGQDDDAFAGVTVAEMARLYGSISRGGKEVAKHFFITKITSPSGDVVYRAPTTETSEQLVDPVAAWQVRSCLQLDSTKTFDPSWNEQVRELGFQDTIACAGTTYAWTDAWFVGANSKIACAVWTGFDTKKGSILKNGDGRNLLGSFWLEMMEEAAYLGEGEEVSVPENTVAVKICSVSGELAGTGCYLEVPLEDGMEFVSSSYVEYLRHGSALPRACSAHPSHSAIDALLQEENSFPSQRNTPSFNQIIPYSPTVIGEDPYQALSGVFLPEQEDVAEQESSEETAQEPDALEPLPLEPDSVEPFEPDAVEEPDAIEPFEPDFLEPLPVESVPSDLPEIEIVPLDLHEGNL